MKNKIILFLFLIFISSSVFASLISDYNIAMSKYREQNFKEASILFQNIRENYSAGLQFEVSLYYLARCEEYLENFNKAAYLYKSFYKSYPNSVFSTIAKDHYQYITDNFDVSLPEKDESDFEIEHTDTRTRNIPRSHVVKEGETLWSIAQKLFGDGRKYKLLLEINELEDILDIKPGDILYTDEIVKVDAKQGQIQVAPKSAAKITDPELKPERTSDVFNLANHNFTLQNYDKSISLYKDFLKLSTPNDKNYENALYNLALAYNISRDISNAVHYFNQYIDLFPVGSFIKQVYFNLGRIHFDILNDDITAKFYFDKVMTFLPEDELNKSASNYLRSIAQKRAERRGLKSTHEISDREIIPGLRLRQDTVSRDKNLQKDTFTRDANLLEQLEDFNKQTELHQLQPRLNIKDSLALEQQVADFRISSQPPRAIPNEYHDISQILKEGRIFLNPAKEIEKRPAQMRFDDRIQERNENYYLRNGYENALKGMYGQAIHYYKQAIHHFPRRPTAYNNLAFLYAELGSNLDEAKDLVYRAINMAPENKGNYLDTLGWIYYKEGDFLRAKELIERAIFYNESPRKRYNLGMVLLKLNKKDLAYEQFKRVVILDPESALASKTRLEIRKLE